MARGENQKQKLFRILEILMEKTDEENGITVNELIEELEMLGIHAERKSIYDDFATLEELGFPVFRLYGNPPSYTLGERIFELSELKMLVDAVNSSKFITAEKSGEIIEKLRIFAGKGGKRELSRYIHVGDRAKRENVFSMYTIDAVHKAIRENRRIVFAYTEYTAAKKRVLKHGGELYDVSPKALIWSDGNYYLVGFYEKAGILKHFRVDKMYKTTMSENPTSIAAANIKLNFSDFSHKIFGMYRGEEVLVTIDAKEHLAGAVIDKFGSGVTFMKSELGFTFRARVMLSPVFYSWVMGFGGDMIILSPDVAREGIRDMAEKILNTHKEKTAETE